MLCLPSVADRLLVSSLVVQAKVRAFQTISPHLSGQFPRNIKAHYLLQFSFELQVFTSPHHTANMRSTLALSVAAVAGIAAAQSSTQSNYPYTIDPNSVPSSTRGMCKLHLYLWSMTDFAIDYWCQQNEAQCPLICLQQPGVTSSTTQDNECDSVSLPNPLFGHESAEIGSACGQTVFNLI